MPCNVKMGRSFRICLWSRRRRHLFKEEWEGKRARARGRRMGDAEEATKQEKGNLCYPSQNQESHILGRKRSIPVRLEPCLTSGDRQRSIPTFRTGVGGQEKARRRKNRWWKFVWVLAGIPPFLDGNSWKWAEIRGGKRGEIFRGKKMLKAADSSLFLSRFPSVRIPAMGLKLKRIPFDEKTHTHGES